MLFKHNFVADSPVIKGMCIGKAGNITARDTKSYFKEILVDHADKLGIEDLIDIAAGIDVF